jgi:hypothetical protein
MSDYKPGKYKAVLASLNFYEIVHYITIHEDNTVTEEKMKGISSDPVIFTNPRIWDYDLLEEYVLTEIGGNYA